MIYKVNFNEGYSTMNENKNGINEKMVAIFENILKLEQRYVSYHIDEKVSMTEVHTIAAIGIDELKSMSEIAKMLYITVGTLTVAVNNLVKKGYAQRYKSEEDKRIVKIALTRSGKKIYDVHKMFHNELSHTLMKGFDEKEQHVVIRALTNLEEYINLEYEEIGIRKNVK